MSARGAVRPERAARDETAPLGPEAPTPAAPPDDASAFADELPPDFWEEVPLPDPPQRAPQDAAPAGAGTDRAAQHPEDDPRFRLLQSLFPGRLVAWQAHAPRSEEDAYGDAAYRDTPETLHGDAHDGLEEGETVD